MILFFVFCAQLAWAEVTVEIKGDEVIAAEKDANGITKFFSVGKVAKIEKGTRVFHWGDEDDIARWLTQGKVDSGELDFLVTQFARQAAGGGFYASVDALDSSDFGLKAVAVTLPELKGVHGPYPDAIADKIELARKLREKGFSYISYHPTWLNIIDSEPLQKISNPTTDDFLKSPSLAIFRSLGAIETRGLIDLNHPEIQKKQPIFSKIMTGQPINAAEKATAWQEVYPVLYYPPWIPRSVVKFFRSEIEQQITRQVQQQLKGASTSLVGYELMIRNGRQLGLDYDAILGSNATHKPKASLIEFHPQNLPKLSKLDSFGQKLARAMEFIDYNDLMLELAQGAREPWRRYDTDGQRPMLDRWVEATDKKFTEDADSIDTKIALNRILSGNSTADIRDTQIIAGGDIMVNGKGYYRITELEKKALEANPFLTIEIIPDPSAKPPQKLYLGRHEYPSAKTYQKFAKYLTPELINELQAAQNAGKLESTPGLTQKVLRCLLEKTKTSSKTPIEMYLLDMSIHPFPDYNGRTLRAVYQLQTEVPLFLRDFDHDLFLTHEQFIPEAINGEGQLMTIRQKMLDEYKKNPGNPKYYDVPELWQLAVETDLKPKDPVAFVRETKAFYLDPANQDLLRHKKLFEFDNTIRQVCVTRRLNSFLRE